jgi:ADP-ribosylglycohydrolase
MNMYNKILGGFLGAAIGDAMGAATEMRTTEQIVSHFGGFVNTFVDPPKDTFARNNVAGQVTDDFSMAYCIAKAIIKHDSSATEQVAREGILDWANHDEYYIPFAGPTTRAAINTMLGGDMKEPEGIHVYSAQATNGSAMKIFPVGLLNPGNLNQAIEDAITVSMPTHGNHLAISGACAIAAAVSEAMNVKATVYSVIQAGLYGAIQGEKRGKEVGVTVCGPSVIKRIELAIEIALKSHSIEETMQSMRDTIGCGLHISEAVPAAFGFLIAAQGDSMKSIFCGVNAGNDTDTIASIVGALGGTLNGYTSFPEGYLDLIETKNSMDLRGLSQSFEAIIRR